MEEIIKMSHIGVIQLLGKALNEVFDFEYLHNLNLLELEILRDTLVSKYNKTIMNNQKSLVA